MTSKWINKHWVRLVKVQAPVVLPEHDRHHNEHLHLEKFNTWNAFLLVSSNSAKAVRVKAPNVRQQNYLGRILNPNTTLLSLRGLNCSNFLHLHWLGGPPYVVNLLPQQDVSEVADLPSVHKQCRCVRMELDVAFCEHIYLSQVHCSGVLVI